jgi:hypothetical protein
MHIINPWPFLGIRTFSTALLLTLACATEAIPQPKSIERVNTPLLNYPEIAALTIYIRNTGGSDGNDGLTYETALRSLEGARLLVEEKKYTGPIEILISPGDYTVGD